MSHCHLDTDEWSMSMAEARKVSDVCALLPWSRRVDAVSKLTAARGIDKSGTAGDTSESTIRPRGGDNSSSASRKTLAR